MYRVQKILSMLGVLSRRECEKNIIKGLVKVNNVIATLGTKVKIGDLITFNKNQYAVSSAMFNSKIEILVYHKPCGEIVTSNDNANRKTVFERLPDIDGKWINIGRLDLETSGLLLFTNNGDIANKMMHPSSNISRKYEVTIKGSFNDLKKEQCIKGLDIGMSETGKFDSISACKLTANKYIVTLKTGKNREVRRVFRSVGCTVIKLKRIQYDNIKLNNLLAGEYRYLTEKEIKLLSISFES
ncbi:rRNA pseudouridine synthase [Gammaproteobacteria bacterium]|nr:rRNA pseudouridine synthase [Gammaproteobacteria bacterium]